MGGRRPAGGTWLATVVFALLLALGGCALATVSARLAGQSRLPAVAAAGLSARLTAGAAGPTAPGTAPAGKGLVEITVKWPARAAQLIPDSSTRVLFEVSSNSVLVASASVTRPAGPGGTSTASFEFDAGTFKLHATAESGPAGAPVAVATASTEFTVVAGVRTPVGLSLLAAYPPAVTRFNTTWGAVGESVTLNGSNLGLSWASTPSVSFTGSGASVSAIVTSLSANAMTVTVPVGALSGVLSVSVDGSATSSGQFAVPAPELRVVSTAIASAGDTIYLDGGFGQSATVNFPGGVTAAATVLGPRRAKAVVPANTTVGNLTVTTGGVTTAGRPFRAPTFSLGLGYVFQGPYDQAAEGRPMPRLVTARRYFGSAVVGHYLYVLGGTDGSYLRRVERAGIDAAGNLGAFSTVAGVALATGRIDFGSAVVGNYLYVFGGYDGSVLNSVERASIDADGNLGAFSTVAGINFGTARYRFGSAVIGNFLYVFGGLNDSGYLGSVERAGIDADGNLSTFSTVAGINFGTARETFGSAVVSDYLYVFGGLGDSGYLDSVERAGIDAGGNLGAFSTVAGVNLATANRYFNSAVVGNNLYVFGGNSGSNRNSLERAAIDAGGNLGTFSTVAGVTLATARHGFGSAVVGNHLVVLGGGGNSGYLNNVERISLNASGNLGAFGTVAGISLVAGRDFLGSAVVGNYLYLFGGDNAGTFYLNTVERASIDAGGNLGAFSAVAGVTLATARRQACSAVIGDFLYVFGGYNGSVLNKVERAAIDAGGNLGAFSTVAGITFNTARTGFGSAVIGDYLYVFGGLGPLNSVERATIDAGGSLGAFSTVAGVNLVTARYNFGSAVVGTYLYVFGGHNGPSGLTSVERASIDSSGNLGAFSTVAGVTLASARYEFNSAVVGTHVYVFGGAGSSNTVERASIDAGGNLSTFSTIAGLTLATDRFRFGSAIVGNYLHVFGGQRIGGGGGYLANVERAILQ